MATTANPPLESLPVELREGIFKEVLQSHFVLRPIKKESNEKLRRKRTFHLPLLVALVNDPHSYELAYATFYKYNRFRLDTYEELARLTSDETYQPIKYVRHLEFWRYYWPVERRDYVKRYHLTLLAADKWPKLKTLQIDIESLLFFPQDSSMSDLIRKLLDNESKQIGYLVCVGVGMYVCGLGKQYELRYEHSSLVRAWNKAQGQAAGALHKPIMNYLEVGMIWNNWPPPDRYIWEIDDSENLAEDLSIVGWMELYDELVRQEIASGADTAAAQNPGRDPILTIVSKMARHVPRVFGKKAYAPMIHKQWTGSARLRDVTADKYSQEVLEWVGDMLVANQHIFNFMW